MAKPKIKGRSGGATGLFFTNPKKGLEFINSGCEILNCVLAGSGGGWPLGRISNVVGDKSTGKTLLAIEAMANFNHQYPDGTMCYAETEAAFDDNYARALGMDMSHVLRPKVDTVEDLFDDMVEFLAKVGKKGRGLYIVDSLDALSDKAEKGRGIDAPTYGASKPKQLGQLFRRLIKPLERSLVHVMIISQTRDNIGVTFGEKHTRSGGRALDFYASQILWLANLGQLKKTIEGITRTVGVQVKSKCKKNKIDLPFRECSFDILFGYGIDDITSNLNYLKSVRHQYKIDGRYVDSGGTFRRLLENAGSKYRAELIGDLNKTVMDVWHQKETKFLPERGKYAERASYEEQREQRGESE